MRILIMNNKLKTSRISAFGFFVVAGFLMAAGCSHKMKFSRDKAAFNASSPIQTFRSVADMNDSYFVIRENNYFEFYRQLFDSVKNTHYPGKYTRDGDTMLLKFYDKKGELLLGSKAFINLAGTEIIFFNRKPVKKEDFIP